MKIQLKVQNLRHPSIAPKPASGVHWIFLLFDTPGLDGAYHSQYLVRGGVQDRLPIYYRANTETQTSIYLCPHWLIWPFWITTYLTSLDCGRKPDHWEEKQIKETMKEPHTCNLQTDGPPNTIHITVEINQIVVISISRWHSSDLGYVWKKKEENHFYSFT